MASLRDCCAYLQWSAEAAGQYSDDTAVTRLPYGSAEKQWVQGLYEAWKKPNIFQGLAVFGDHGTRPDDSVCLWVAIE